MRTAGWCGSPTGAVIRLVSQLAMPVHTPDLGFDSAAASTCTCRKRWLSTTSTAGCESKPTEAVLRGSHARPRLSWPCPSRLPHSGCTPCRMLQMARSPFNACHAHPDTWDQVCFLCCLHLCMHAADFAFSTRCYLCTCCTAAPLPKHAKSGVQRPACSQGKPVCAVHAKRPHCLPNSSDRSGVQLSAHKRNTPCHV